MLERIFKTLSVEITVDQYKELERIKKEEQINKGETIRKALSEYLKKRR